MFQLLKRASELDELQKILTTPKPVVTKTRHEQAVASFVQYQSTQLPLIPQETWQNYTLESMNLVRAYIAGRQGPDKQPSPGLGNILPLATPAAVPGPSSSYPASTQFYQSQGNGFFPTPSPVFPSRPPNTGMYTSGTYLPVTTYQSTYLAPPTTYFQLINPPRPTVLAPSYPPS